jgi:LacI family transcriptional regulator
MAQSMMARVTILDVAHQAGVSLATVSRVLNNKEDVSDETRQHVLKTIQELDFRPSGIARSLATRQSGTLGLIVPDITNPFSAEIARGVEQLASAENYQVFLCIAEQDPQRELEVLDSLREKQVDGVILCSSCLDDSQLSEVLRNHPAAVLVNRLPPEAVADLAVSAVMVDEKAGGEMMTRHLLLKRKAVGFLAGPPLSKSCRERYSGYRLAYQAAGLTFQPEWVRHCDSDVEGGYQAATALLTQRPELEALFCCNDLMAIGALQACAASGKPVPQSVAIAGFDDIPAAALVSPALTTCRVPRYDLGCQAAQALLDQIQGCKDGCGQIILPAELIVRQSAP